MEPTSESRQQRRARERAEAKAARRAAPARPLSVDELRALSFNQLARPNCSACGGPIRWVGADEARTHGLDVDAAKAHLHATDDEAMEYWVCDSCGEAGAMGPTKV
jgi:hypothetical protein